MLLQQPRLLDRTANPDTLWPSVAAWYMVVAITSHTLSPTNKLLSQTFDVLYSYD